jgi:phosphoadenosine phosphosulfate reductase
MSTADLSFASLASDRLLLQDADADAAIRWAYKRFGASLTIASSFGPEDIALLHLTSQLAPSARIITLDTGRLHEETLALIDDLRTRWHLNLHIYYPDAEATQALVARDGLFGFRSSIDARRACCDIRKVEPLRRALQDSPCWITGLRAEQSPTRANTPMLELDLSHGTRYKLNPLIHWTRQQLQEYTQTHALPIHPLQHQGYLSIGCAPCTRAVAPGEHERAGRWWWEQPDSRECGLHPVKHTPPQS